MTNCLQSCVEGGLHALQVGVVLRHTGEIRGLQGPFAPIEAQLRPASILVGSVTLETLVREDRADVPVDC